MSAGHRPTRVLMTKWLTLVAVGTLFLCLVSTLTTSAAPPVQRTFASPEEAIEALVAAAKVGDRQALEAILGPGSRALIRSGDRRADEQGREHFVRNYEQAHRLEHPSETKAIVLIGPDAWPMPIPVVKVGDTWRFDTAASQEEILNRRIGRNELNAVQVCLAYVDAQREYARVPREGDGLLKYAMKFRSDPGKKNGLYWPQAGDEESPLGPLVAKAEAEGYAGKTAGGRPTPYHGYFYRILTAQGPAAPDGAFDYVVDGKMLGGFALVAFPARYGVSGVMTFILNHQGIVYEKDLGPDTKARARAMPTYSPDPTWKPVEAPSSPGR